MSVGLIVIQGLVETFLYSSGTSPFEDDDRYNAEDKTLRAYCTFVLYLLWLCGCAVAGFVVLMVRMGYNNHVCYGFARPICSC
jgi:hypothetical protein